VRVFLDTNVLVAAFATRGLCADIVRTILADHQLITGDVVLTELRAVLEERIKLPTITVTEIVRSLRSHEVVPKPAEPSSLGIRDTDDEWIVASAVAGHADVLVTGDQDLLAVADRSPIPILSPRGFWEQLRSSS
jgi:putative PIN family toxin of toxin-antitoxin system